MERSGQSWKVGEIKLIEVGKGLNMVGGGERSFRDDVLVFGW